MPRNMSFFLTQEPFKAKTKTVTRRLGWNFLKPGDIINGCVKCQGLKKGEKVEVLGQIRIVSAAKQRLHLITKDDCKREGFPEMSPHQFVEMFCKHMKCLPAILVNRIEFEHIKRGQNDV